MRAILVEGHPYITTKRKTMKTGITACTLLCAGFCGYLFGIATLFASGYILGCIFAVLFIMQNSIGPDTGYGDNFKSISDGDSTN